MIFQPWSIVANSILNFLKMSLLFPFLYVFFLELDRIYFHNFNFHLTKNKNLNIIISQIFSLYSTLLLELKGNRVCGTTKKKSFRNRMKGKKIKTFNRNNLYVHYSCINFSSIYNSEFYFHTMSILLRCITTSSTSNIRKLDRLKPSLMSLYCVFRKFFIENQNFSTIVQSLNQLIQIFNLNPSYHYLENT